MVLKEGVCEGVTGSETRRMELGFDVWASLSTNRAVEPSVASSLPFSLRLIADSVVTAAMGLTLLPLL
jgi:hypothetical protein